MDLMSLSLLVFDFPSSLSLQLAVAVSCPLTAAKVALSVSNLMIASPAEIVSSTTPSSDPPLGFGGTGGGLLLVFFRGDFARTAWPAPFSFEASTPAFLEPVAELALLPSGFGVFARKLELLLGPASATVPGGGLLLWAEDREGRRLGDGDRGGGGLPPWSPRWFSQAFVGRINPPSTTSTWSLADPTETFFWATSPFLVPSMSSLSSVRSLILVFELVCFASPWFSFPPTVFLVGLPALAWPLVGTASLMISGAFPFTSTFDPPAVFFLSPSPFWPFLFLPPNAFFSFFAKTSFVCLDALLPPCFSPTFFLPVFFSVTFESLTISTGAGVRSMIMGEGAKVSSMMVSATSSSSGVSVETSSKLDCKKWFSDRPVSSLTPSCV